VEHTNVVEKTITNIGNENSFSQSLDKIAIENFISSLHNQVGGETATSAAAASLTVHDILTPDINLTVPVVSSTVHNVSASSNASSSDKLSMDEEAIKKLENNLSTTSGSQSESAQPATINETTDVSEEITNLVNKIVSDAVVKARQMIEDERRMMDSFELVEKNELNEHELKQIEKDQQKRSVELAEVKLGGSGSSEAQATFDRNSSSMAFSSGSPKSAAAADQTVIVNESNTTLNSTAASTKKASNKKSPDVDCFSCTVL
jgi:hypothetical protein